MHNKLSLEICSIVYSDIQNNCYKVTPINDYMDITYDAIPIGARTLVDRGVTEVSSYQLGELVICIMPKISGPQDSTVMQTCLILCCMPNVTTPSVSSAATSESPYLDKLKDTRTLTSVQYPKRYKTDNLVPGDTHVAGENTVIHIGDSTISADAGYSGITLTSVDGSLRTKALVRSNESLHSDSRDFVVNNTTLHVARTKDIQTDTDLTLDIDGDLIGGQLTATIGSDNVVTTKQYVAQMGSITTQATQGIVFEQRDKLDAVYTPGYPRAFNSDADIKNEDVPPSDVFSNVVNSKQWKATGEATPKSSYKAGFGLLPSGGFIIRDKWGSEVRMENGDIQITAARNVVVVNGGDTSILCKGTLSGLINQGLDVLTHGKLSVCSGKDGLVVNTPGTCQIHSKVMSLSGSAGISLTCGESAVELTDKAITIVSDDINNIAEKRVIVFGKSRVLTATPYAVSDVGNGEIHQAASALTIHGSVSISSGRYRAGTINGTSIAPISSAVCLAVDGNVFTSGTITCAESISASGGLQGEYVNVVKANPDFGVYTIKRKDLTDSTTAVDNALRQLNKSSAGFGSLSLELSNATTLSERDKLSLFTEADNGLELSIIQPTYKQAKANLNPSVTVDNNGEQRYIYPGKEFWEGSHLAVITNTDKTLLEEGFKSSREITKNLKV